MSKSVETKGLNIAKLKGPKKLRTQIRMWLSRSNAPPPTGTPIPPPPPYLYLVRLALKLQRDVVVGGEGLDLAAGQADGVVRQQHGHLQQHQAALRHHGGCRASLLLPLLLIVLLSLFRGWMPFLPAHRAAMALCAWPLGGEEKAGQLPLSVSLTWTFVGGSLDHPLWHLSTQARMDWIMWVLWLTACSDYWPLKNS